jgi:hypothetical protein
MVYQTSLELRQPNARFLFITYVYTLIGVIENLSNMLKYTEWNISKFW